MKKKLLAVCLTSVFLFNLTGCDDRESLANGYIASPNSDIIDFEVVDENFSGGTILVDKNTKVLYYWVRSQRGGITPIYNSDGSLKLYEE